MRKSNSASWLPFLLFGVLLVVGIGLTIFNYRFAVQNPGGNDFLARWMGARFWLKEGISPYDEQVSLATQQMIYGHPADPAQGEDINHFVYPLYSMLFFAPFGLFDFPVARALWMTGLEISTVLLVFVSLQLVGWRTSIFKTVALVLFAMLWYHGVRTLILGQFAGINALLIALALLFIQQKQDVPAGILLALSTSKPQMAVLLVPFTLLWAFSNDRRGIIGGLLITLGVLMLASFALVPDWFIAMIRQITEYPSYTAYTNIDSPLSYLADLMPGIRSTLNSLLHVLAGLYLLIEWGLAWRKDQRHFLWTAAMTMVVTNLIAYRTATTNYMMLLPVLFLIFRVWEYRWKGLGVGAVWFNLLLFLIGLWALFLVTVQGNQEAPIMFIPLPFFCLIGLWWVRWWAMRPDRLLFDELAARLG
ncbi:MAG: DUF2029 domain-containing protein [Anaerolineales bacterium]|nr:DUF2029 domain-containing protein [Anaerolineales bacterium]